MAIRIYVRTDGWFHLLPKAFWGPVLWCTLHDRPEQAGDDLSNEAEWLEAFTETIPCETCRGHFREYQQQHPPDFSSARAYFAWTVEAHDAVNDRLGTRRVGWQEKLWGPHP